MTDLTSSSSRPKGSLPFPIKRRPVEVGYQTRILAGNSNLPLAQEIAKQLGLEMTPCRVQRFANGEIDVKICENVRGDDVFILQSPCNVPDAGLDVNTALMELLLLIHTARLASAKRITAVMPYYAYSRQDRKTQSRVPISASVVAQLIQSMGVDRVITLDLHCGQIQGFFRNLPLDNLSMSHEFVHFLRDHVHDLDPSRTVVVSPDAGGVERATAVADMLRVSHVVTILRRRVGEESGRDSLRGASTEDGTMHRANPLDPEGEIEKKYCMQIVGDVSEYTCVIVDDMIDTGSRLVAAANALHQHGAKRILACATHGILTDPACSRIMECPALEMVCVTDGIPQRHNMHRCPKLVVLSLAPLLAHAIDRVHEEQSLSEMFRQVVTGNELVLGGSMTKL